MTISPLDYLLDQGIQVKQRVQNIEMVDLPPLVVRAGRSTTQNIGGTFVYTVIDYDTTVEDPRSCVTVSPNWRFNALLGGYYWVSAHARFVVSANWAQGEPADLRVYINGSPDLSLAYAANIGIGGAPLLSGGGLVHLSENDYLEIFVAQGSGGGSNLAGGVLTNWVSIAKVTI